MTGSPAWDFLVQVLTTWCERGGLKLVSIDDTQPTDNPSILNVTFKASGIHEFKVAVGDIEQARLYAAPVGGTA